MDTMFKIRDEIKKKLDTADRETLEKIESILLYGEDDPLLTMAKEQEVSFNKGIEDADAGRFTKHEEVKKKFKQWLTK